LLAILLTASTSGATIVARVTDCTTCSPYEDGSYQPAWSPDGNFLAYVTSNSYPPWYEFWQSIYVSPLHGGQGYYVYGESGLVQWPAWSPDSRALVFATGEGLFVSTLGNPEPSVLLRGFGYRHPAWSPDGTKVAVECTGNLWLLPATGGTPTQLTTQGGRSPTWSPDGTRIAYETGNAIWIVPITAGEPKLLTTGTDPAWSADGTWIAFSSSRRGNADIWVIAFTGGTAVRITNDPATETDPTWSPDGRSIAFTASNQYCNCIWVAANLPDFRVGVVPHSWSEVKDLYR
jgi:TolB protein